MSKRTDWKAIATRAIVVPVYIYLSLFAVISTYNLDLMPNPLEWNYIVRTVYSLVVVSIQGLVLIGCLEGNFKK